MHPLTATGWDKEEYQQHQQKISTNVCSCRMCKPYVTLWYMSSSVHLALEFAIGPAIGKIVPR